MHVKTAPVIQTALTDPAGPERLDETLRALDRLAPMGVAVCLHVRFARSFSGLATASPLVLSRSYPADWVESYIEAGYALRDPVIWWANGTTGACRWSEIGIDDPFGVFPAARQHGLIFGAAISHGPSASRSVAGLARGDREFTDAEIATARDLVAQLHEMTDPACDLTDPQSEALRVIASGNRYAEAAHDLGISQSALKARLTSARKRLGVRTLPEAVQKAQALRLI